MENTIKKFEFPAWEDFSRANQAFLDRGEYKGHHVQVHVTDNLYLLIDCQNNSCVFSGSEDVIRFAWCTKNEFAISSVLYKNCEAGYLMGCAHLINSANEFKKHLEAFAGSHAFDIRRRIDRYNTENPVPEEASATDGAEEPMEGDR